jgi:hypothetical protein
VARPRRRPARRRALGPLVHRPVGLRMKALYASRRPAARRRSGPDLGLHRPRENGTGRCGTSPRRPGSSRRSTATSRDGPAPSRASGPEGRRLDRLRLVDLQRRLRADDRRARRAQPRGQPTRRRLGGGGVGLRLAGQPPRDVQPRLGRPRRPPLAQGGPPGPPVRRRRRPGLRLLGPGGPGPRPGRSLEDGPRPLGRPRRARLPRDQAADGRRCARRPGPRLPRRRLPLPDEGRRQGLALRPLGAGRRPVADALRAVRVPRAQPGLPRAAEQPRGQGLPRAGQPLRPRWPRPSSPASSRRTASPSTTSAAR